MHQILTKRIKISTRAAIVVFGTMSGLIWAALGGGFVSDESSGELATELGAGVITGILVSFLLKSPLSKCGKLATLGYGFLSLPFGAFAFGFITTLIQLTVKGFTGTSYNWAATFNPVEAGCFLALVSVSSILAIVFFPLAVITTFLLRMVIKRRVQPGNVV